MLGCVRDCLTDDGIGQARGVSLAREHAGQPPGLDLDAEAVHRPQLLVHHRARPIAFIRIADGGQRRLSHVIVDALGTQLTRQRTPGKTTIGMLGAHEPGYRIDRREYALPEIAFAADELAVLGLASRAWAQASLAGPAAQALRKLKAAGVERDDSSLIGIEPRVRTAEPAFERVKNAVLERIPVAFAYRTAGSGEVATRHVQPWGIASWHGRWYLTGFDTDRDAPRVFRLGRIEGEVVTEGKPASYEVPIGHEPRAMISNMVVERDPLPAVLLVRAGAGHSLRRRASAVEDLAGTWSHVDVDFTDTEAFADEISSFGPDVLVQSPTELRESVIRRLTGAMGPGPGSEEARA